MDKNSAYQAIHLITENSLQSSLLKDSLESTLGSDVDLISVHDMTDSSFKNQSNIKELNIIDISAIHGEDIENYRKVKKQLRSHSDEVLINCANDRQESDVLTWNDLVGVFYTDDDIDTLSRGITKVCSGEFWMSRKMSQDYIQYYRRNADVHTHRDSESFAKLTKREQEILRLLGGGASNLDIAEELAVSENTVKTHLHNVFKKINAKNRLQAFIWAKENISADDFY